MFIFQVQSNKQQISSLKRKNSDGIDDLRPGELSSKVNPRWTPEELLLAVQGIRKYGKNKNFQKTIMKTQSRFLAFTLLIFSGKDFQTIAETIGTKTETHLKTFWVNYRRRYNLDSILREWDNEKGSGGSGASSSVIATASPSNFF